MYPSWAALGQTNRRDLSSPHVRILEEKSSKNAQRNASVSASISSPPNTADETKLILATGVERNGTGHKASIEVIMSSGRMSGSKMVKEVGRSGWRCGHQDKVHLC